MSFRASVASIDPMVDTTDPMDAGVLPELVMGPMMQYRHGVLPGIIVATSPRKPSIPPWTIGFPSSTAQRLASSLPSIESRHSTRMSQSAMMDMVLLSKRHTWHSTSASGSRDSIHSARISAFGLPSPTWPQ